MASFRNCRALRILIPIVTSSMLFALTNEIKSTLQRVDFGSIWWFITRALSAFETPASQRLHPQRCRAEMIFFERVSLFAVQLKMHADPIPSRSKIQPADTLGREQCQSVL